MADGGETLMDGNSDSLERKRNRNILSSTDSEGVHSPQHKLHIAQDDGTPIRTAPPDNIHDIYTLLQTMREEQNKTLAKIRAENLATKRMVESKLDKLKKDLMESMENRIKAVRDEFILEIGQMQTKLDNFVATTKSHDEHIRQINEAHGAGQVTAREPYEPQVSLIVSYIPYQQGEDIQKKMEEMIHVHLELLNEKIVRCERTRPRDNRPSGVIKIELSSLNSKINVLRAKSKLKSVEGFKTYVHTIC